MKDYSLNSKDSKTFILNYKVEDNQIVVNLASSENYIIPYTKDNERKILDMMEKQVLDSDKFVSKQEKRFSSAWKWSIFSGACLATISIILATGNATEPVVSGIFAGWFVFDIATRIYIMVDSKRKIKDIYKNKMFLNNRELLNEKVKSNQNILSNVDTKTKELVSSTPEDKPVFTINSIDKIKYNELRKILENIKRDEQFGFDYSPDEEERPKVRVRK